MRGWSEERAATELADLAERKGLARPGVDGKSFSRWERGVTKPSPYYAPLLCELYGWSAAELDLVQPKAATVGLELADEPELEDLEEAVQRLRRSYSTTPPQELERRLEERLRQFRSLAAREQAAFASGAMAALRLPRETIEHAVEVVRQNENPRTRNFWPMRVANARLEWAAALTDLGDEDGAYALALQALEPQWMRPDTERRTRMLLARMRDPRLRDRLAEQLREALTLAHRR